MQFCVVRYLGLLFVASILCLVRTTPVNVNYPETRDVYVPPVLYPRNGTIWRVGERHNVKWDTSNPPAQITNGKGLILLRKGDYTTPLILANGFNILLGKIEVTVPWVLDGDDYRIVLFGDSGNFSPYLTITS